MHSYISFKLIPVMGLLCLFCQSVQAQQVTTSESAETIQHAHPETKRQLQTVQQKTKLLEQQKATQAALQMQTGRILKMDKLAGAFRFKILTPKGRIKEVTIQRESSALPTQPPLTTNYNQGNIQDGPILFTPHVPKTTKATKQKESEQ